MMLRRVPRSSSERIGKVTASDVFGFIPPAMLLSMIRVPTREHATVAASVDSVHSDASLRRDHERLLPERGPVYATSRGR